MTKRVPGSDRTHEALNDLIEGRLQMENAKTDLVKLTTRLIIEEGLEAEVRDRHCHGNYIGQQSPIGRKDSGFSGRGF